MKKFGITLLIIIMSFCMFSACSNTGGGHATNNSGTEVNDNDPNIDDQTEGQMEDEEETTQLETQKVDDSFFVGTWVANSDKAKYMYGNVTITINEDGTWDGNITDEEIHGKWKHSGDGIRLTSDVIPFNMVYSSNNNVVLQETDDAVRVVLTKQ